MKKTYDFPSGQQTLLFEIFGGYCEEDERKTLAENIRELSPERIEDLRQSVDEVLKTIPYKQREVLKFLYGIDTGLSPLTREKIGEMFNFTSACVRQHELKARRMCWHPTRIRLLQQFVSNRDDAL